MRLNLTGAVQGPLPGRQVRHMPGIPSQIRVDDAASLLRAAGAPPHPRP